MGRIIVTEFIAVDGVVEAPGGEVGYKHAGWVGLVPFTDEFGAFKYGEVVDADAHLLGRVTYESFAGAWPGRAGDKMADRLNSMLKYVVTSQSEIGWENCRIVKGDVVAELTALRDEVGDLLIAGSIQLVQSLFKADMVDEYRLAVFPVILGSGRRLFPDNADDIRTLKLIDSKIFDNGVNLLTYHRAD